MSGPGGVGIGSAPFFVEESSVFGEGSEHEGTTHVGPEHARGDWRVGVEGDCFESEAGEGAPEGEEDEPGDSVELGDGWAACLVRFPVVVVLLQACCSVDIVRGWSLFI